MLWVEETEEKVSSNNNKLRIVALKKSREETSRSKSVDQLNIGKYRVKIGLKLVYTKVIKIVKKKKRNDCLRK